MSIDHYRYIKPIPDKFLNWKEENLVIEYSDWIFEQSNCPSLKIDIPVPVNDIWNEANANFKHFVKHRDFENNKGWKSATIHGIDTPYTNSWAFYGLATEPLYNWTSLGNVCLKTKEWLQNFPCTQFQRVRFMLLEPGGFIATHKDNEHRALDAINVAITHPVDCNFYMEDADIIPWRPGDVRLVDIGRNHSVVNDSDYPRLHMIIHGWWSKELKIKACIAYDSLASLYF